MTLPAPARLESSIVKRSLSALAFPWVLRLVLAHLADDCASLSAAARVNRHWNVPATDLLWQQPSETAFHCATIAMARRHAANGMTMQTAPPLIMARLQFFADKVRSIVVARHLLCVAMLAFPHLRALQLPWLSLVVPRHDRVHRAVLTRLIVPHLVRLTAHLDPNIVALLLAHRPRLRDFHVLGIEGHVDFRDKAEADAFAAKAALDGRLQAVRTPWEAVFKVFYNFLPHTCAKSLRRLTLRNVDTEQMGTVILRAIAGHATLQELTTQSYTWNQTLLARLARAARREWMFFELRSLDIAIAAGDVPQLLRIVNPFQLESLALDVMPNECCRRIYHWGPPFYVHVSDGPPSAHEVGGYKAAVPRNGPADAAGAALEAMEGCRERLRTLRLNFFVDTVLPRRAVVGLRQLAALEELTIAARGEGVVVRAELGTADLTALLAPLFRLRHLELSAENDVTSRWLFLVGHACPLLRELHMPRNVCDIMSLAEAGHGQVPLFAHLQKLRVGEFHAKPGEIRTVDGQSTWDTWASHHAEMLHSHTPKLSDVTVVFGNDEFNAALSQHYLARAAPGAQWWRSQAGKS